MPPTQASKILPPSPAVMYHVCSIMYPSSPSTCYSPPETTVYKFVRLPHWVMPKLCDPPCQFLFMNPTPNPTPTPQTREEQHEFFIPCITYNKNSIKNDFFILCIGWVYNTATRPSKCLTAELLYTMPRFQRSHNCSLFCCGGPQRTHSRLRVMTYDRDSKTRLLAQTFAHVVRFNIDLYGDRLPYCYKVCIYDLWTKLKPMFCPYNGRYRSILLLNTKLRCWQSDFCIISKRKCFAFWLYLAKLMSLNMGVGNTYNL